VAAHSITAVYNGDASFNANTNSPALTQTVNKDNSSVTLSSSTNPVVFGQGDNLHGQRERRSSPAAARPRAR